jgi:hypothetical protein
MSLKKTEHCSVFLWATVSENVYALAMLDEAIMPPPKQTSPSYNTADCPGVTAHWGCVKAS